MKVQTLSFPIRLPDSMQAEALRLLDTSRSAINTILCELWPQLDLFASDRRGPAWKQVEKYLFTRNGQGQTYRVRIEHRLFCDLASREEHSEASLWLRLRTPDEQQKWTWGTWSAQISLPEVVCGYLDQGATTQAPTLREVRGDDGQRMIMLDVILEVPAKYVSDLAQEQRVLGFDWGVRSLITVSILEKPEADGDLPRQVSRPVFLDTGALDGKQVR